MTIRDGPWQAAAEASSLRAISIAESVTEGPIGLKAISDWSFVHKGNNSPASLLWAAGRTMGHGKNSKKDSRTGRCMQAHTVAIQDRLDSVSMFFN